MPVQVNIVDKIGPWRLRSLPHVNYNTNSSFRKNRWTYPTYPNEISIINWVLLYDKPQFWFYNSEYFVQAPLNKKLKKGKKVFCWLLYVVRPCYLLHKFGTTPPPPVPFYVITLLEIAQLGIWTTRTQDNSFVPKTTHTQGNSYPDLLVPKTTRTQDNCRWPGDTVNLGIDLHSTNLVMWEHSDCRTERVRLPQCRVYGPPVLIHVLLITINTDGSMLC